MSKTQMMMTSYVIIFVLVLGLGIIVRPFRSALEIGAHGAGFLVAVFILATAFVRFFTPESSVASTLLSFVIALSGFLLGFLA